MWRVEKNFNDYVLEFETWVVMPAQQELFLGQRQIAGSPLTLKNIALAVESIYMIGHFGDEFDTPFW